MRHRICLSIWAFVLMSALILVSPGFGQYREYYIYGKVVDSQKNPLPDVMIMLRDITTSRSYTVKTDGKGEFKLAGLPHGVYNVVLEKEGYVTKEDEWRFAEPQQRMRKVEVPEVVLVSQAKVQEAQRLKEMEGDIKNAADKIREQDYDGAIAILKEVLEGNPKDVNALYLIGVSYAKNQMYPEAVDALTKVTELAPKFPPAYFELAVCYQQQGEAEKALDYYQKTLELDPNNPDAAYNSGLILFGMNRVDEALVNFEKALSLRPDDPAYLEMAGRCYIHQGNLEKAVDYLEKAKAGYADPEKVKFLDNLIAKLKEQIKKEPAHL
jgi:tetratricopeptide (TPR) repeat protein